MSTKKNNAVPDKMEVARKIDALWTAIKERSGFVSIPHGLFQTVAKSRVSKTKKGELKVTQTKHVSKLGLVAAYVLAWVMFRHRPDDEGKPYFDGDTLLTSRGQLAGIIGVSKGTITKALGLLEALGAIRRDLQERILHGAKLVNDLHIEIDTEVITRLCFPSGNTSAQTGDTSAQNGKTLSSKRADGLSAAERGLSRKEQLDKKTARTPQGVTTKKTTDEEAVNRRRTPSVVAASPPDSRQPSAASPPAGAGYQMKNAIPGTPADQASKLARQLAGKATDSQESSKEDILRHQDLLRFLDFFISEHQARFNEKPKIKANDTEALRDHMRESKWNPVRYAALLAWAWNHIGETVENKNGSTYSYVHCLNSVRLGYFAKHIPKVISDTNSFDLPEMRFDELWPALCDASRLDEDQLQVFFRPEWEQHEAKAQKAQAQAESDRAGREAERTSTEFRRMIQDKFCLEWRERERQLNTQVDFPRPPDLAKQWNLITQEDAGLAQPGREDELIALLFERCGWKEPASQPAPTAAGDDTPAVVTTQQTTPSGSGRREGAPPPPPRPYAPPNVSAEQATDPQPQDAVSSQSVPTKGGSKAEMLEEGILSVACSEQPPVKQKIGNGQRGAEKPVVRQTMEVHDEHGDMVARLVSEGFRLEAVDDFFSGAVDLAGLHHPTYVQAKKWLVEHPNYVREKPEPSAKRRPFWRLPEPSRDISQSRAEFDAAPEAERLKAIERAEAKFREVERGRKNSREARANWLRLQHWQDSLTVAASV